MPPKKQTPPVTFTLKPRGKGLKLAATHITADPNETQYDFAKRVAQAARLPITRLRATLEPSNRVLDKRSHADNPPKVSDLVGDDGEPVLLVKDLGTKLLVLVNLVQVLNCHGKRFISLNMLVPFFFIPCFITCKAHSMDTLSSIRICKRSPGFQP